MPSLLQTLEDLFGTRDLYQVLGVEKDADEKKIRKAYHKTSLKVHPDRANPEDRELSTKKFQALGAAYKVLSEPDSKALYDESGEVDDEGDANLTDRDWTEYWRILFKKITVEDIKNFEAKYRHSDEESADVKKAYVEFEGDMDQILDSVLCAVPDDEARFAELIQGWIDAKEVPAFKKFTRETKENKNKRKKRRDAEAKEAEAHAQELGLGGSEDDLAKMIMQRQSNRAKEADNFFAHLEAKYGGSGSKKGKKKSK